MPLEVSQMQRNRSGRSIVARSVFRYLRAAVFVVVSVVVAAAFIAAAAGIRALGWLIRGVLAIYFPPPFVTGGPDLRLIGVAVFLVVAALLLCRRRYWSALVVLVLPKAFTWVFAWRLMQG
jgi:hypothetical protein